MSYLAGHRVRSLRHISLFRRGYATLHVEEPKVVTDLSSLIDKPIQIGIVGKPGTGKSSLLKAFVEADCAVAHETPGTATDDCIAVNWNFRNHVIRLVDTAGVTKGWDRRQQSCQSKDSLDTRQTINGSHVSVLLLDASEAFIENKFRFPSRHEVQLGNEVIDVGKCLIVAVNKWDLVAEKDRKKFKQNLVDCVNESFSLLKGIPVIFVSARDKVNLTGLLSQSVSLYRKWNMRLNASRLNDWLTAFVARNPPPWEDGQKQYPKFISQTRTRPPTFALHTNTFGTFPQNYLNQMQDLLKEEFGLKGVPIRIHLRSSLMPKPGKRIRHEDVERWKELGPKQAEAVAKLRKRKGVRNSDRNEVI